MSFFSTVKAESFFHAVFSLVSGEFAVFSQFIRDRVFGSISNNMRGSGNRRGCMMVNGGSVRGLRIMGLWMMGFVGILFVRVSDFGRTVRFHTGFFFLHPIDVVSVLGL